MTIITLHHLFFRSIIGDYSGPKYFSSEAMLPQKKYLGPKQSPPISHHDLKKDGAQVLLSKYGGVYFLINLNTLYFSVNFEHIVLFHIS